MEQAPVIEWRRYERQQRAAERRRGGRHRDRAGGAKGVAGREIEVLPNHRGKPLVYLYGRAKARADGIGLEGLDVSMSHSREYAVAFVVGQSRDLEPDRPGWRRKLIGILRERGLLERVDRG